MMTFGGLTPVQRSSKLTAAWGHLLGLLSLSLLVGACSQGPTEIGIGLPDTNATTGTYLIDTVTVRTSTVLRDSVVTSNSAYLLAGRYTDPLLGTVEARSFFRLAQTTLFTPDPSLVFDSVTLVLNSTLPSTNNVDTYRYGDTTKVQTLFAVYPMTAPVSSTQPSYASRRFTKLSYDTTQLLNATLPRRRARRGQSVFRMRLRDDFGRRLLAAGQAGQINTIENFQNYLPGLAILPGASDDASILRFSATSPSAGLYLYYHSPTDANTPLSTIFALPDPGPTSAHCFQISADRRTGIPNLPTQSLQAVSSALTGERTFIEGGLGLQTRLEFPYLTSLRQLGQRVTITQATLVGEVPTNTLTAFLPGPPALDLRLSNINNQPTSPTAYASADYKPGVSSLTGLDQGTYTWQLADYVQNVINNTLPNNGFLVSSQTPELPSRVVLGSRRDPLNKLQMRIYAISLQ